MLNKTLIFTLFITCSMVVDASECGPGKIKYIFNQKEVIKDIDLCVLEEKRGIILLSPSCKDQSCKEIMDPHKRPINLSKYSETLGSPGFKVCKELGGKPQILEFLFPSKYKKDWQQSSRCIFNENTFVSNNFLLKLWKGYIVY